MRESRERAPAFVAMVTARGALQVNTTNTHRVWAERWRCCCCCCCRTSAAQTAYNCNPRTELGSARAPPPATSRRHSLMRCHERAKNTMGALCVLSARLHRHLITFMYIYVPVATLANCVIISGRPRAQFAKQR
jgi:hypothetical protein